MFFHEISKQKNIDDDICNRSSCCKINCTSHFYRSMDKFLDNALAIYLSFISLRIKINEMEDSSKGHKPNKLIV